MLHALQQHAAQQQQSPTYSISLPSQDNYQPPSSLDSASATASKQPQPLPQLRRAPSLAQSLLASTHQTTTASPSLFGDDAVWASLLDNAVRAAPAAATGAVGRGAAGVAVDGVKGGAMRGLEGYLPCELSSPPLDWSLHNRVRLTGSRRALMACVHPLNTQQRTEVLQTFITQRLPSSVSPPPSPSLAVLFASSLLYYRHPATSHSDRHPLTAHLLTAQTAVEPTAYDKRCLQLLARRWSEWEQSLRSVYYQLRNGTIHHFYVLAQHSTLLFLASPAASATPSSPAIVFSRSTASIRASLTTLGVRYTAPYAKATDKSSGETDEAAADNGGARLPKGVRIVKETARREDDGLVSSLLVVTGRDDVHGVFDWLLNAERRVDDVPQLLCDRPFLHAVLAECEVERVDAARMLEDEAKEAVSSNGINEQQMSLTLSGELLPSALLGVMRTLRAASDDDWSMRLWRADDAPAAVNINAVFTLQTMAQCDVQPSTAEHDCAPLCHDEIVHAALRTAGSVESPMVHTVRYSNGVYHVKLQRAGVS